MIETPIAWPQEAPLTTVAEAITRHSYGMPVVVDGDALTVEGPVEEEDAYDYEFDQHDPWADAPGEHDERL